MFYPKNKSWFTGKRIGLVVLLVIILGFVFWVIGTYNNFVTLDQNIKSKWSQVENVYQRQADLIPNFVETAKQYKEYEQDLLTKLTEARSRWTASTGLVERDKTGL